MSAIQTVHPAWKPKILIADGVRWKNGNVFIFFFMYLLLSYPYRKKTRKKTKLFINAFLAGVLFEVHVSKLVKVYLGGCHMVPVNSV